MTLLSAFYQSLNNLFYNGEPIPSPHDSSNPVVVAPETSFETAPEASSSEIANNVTSSSEITTETAALSEAMETDEMNPQAATVSKGSLNEDLYLNKLPDFSYLQNIKNYFVPGTRSFSTYRITTQSEISELKNNYPDVASSKFGSKVVFSSNEASADACNLINPRPPKSMVGQHHTPWTRNDGWETAHHNAQEFEYVVIRLKHLVSIKGVDIDCSTFSSGNVFTYAFLQAGFEKATGEIFWDTVIPLTTLAPNSHNCIVLSNPTDRQYNILRLVAIPNGGINRLRVYGSFPKPGLTGITKSPVDTAYILNGGKVIDCSSSVYGRPNGILYPGHGNMEDCWYSSRSFQLRGMSSKAKKKAKAAQNEWVVIKLGAPSKLKNICIDTSHFANTIASNAQVIAINSPLEYPHRLCSSRWTLIASGVPKPNQVNVLEVNNFGYNQKYTHIQVKIFSEVGIHKIRAMGYVVEEDTYQERNTLVDYFQSWKQGFYDTYNNTGLSRAKLSVPQTKRGSHEIYDSSSSGYASPIAPRYKRTRF